MKENKDVGPHLWGVGGERDLTCGVSIDTRQSKWTASDKHVRKSRKAYKYACQNIILYL